MKNCTLLVVDDNPDNLTVMEALLSEAFPDCRLLLARDAKSALALTGSETVHAGLIDVQMPGVDGIELCRALKASATTQHIPLILITAHNSTSALRARGLDAGADDFISRPIDNVELAARIRVILRIRKAEDELRDMNERLQQIVDERTRELRESEERYRLLFRTMLDGFALHEIAGDGSAAAGNYRFVEVNPAFERLTGLQAAHVQGRSVREILPEIGDELIQTYGRIASTGEPTYFECHVPSMDKHFEVAAFSPRPRQFACVFHDVTERKRAAEALEQLNAALEDKNKELNAIIYAASHDLRSPLVNIQGFSHELERACAKLRDAVARVPLPPDGRERIETLINADFPECVHYIQSGVAKMDRLLVGLLQLSRLGRTALRVEPLDMNDIIRDILQTMEFQLKAGRVAVRVGDLPGCMGDPVQINRVFTNLLDNALKYLDPARPGQICVEGSLENGEAIYRVIDNGIGIPEDCQQKVFEIFQRLNSKTGVPGEGLGLTSVRRMVERHQGRVWVESEPGRGSTFLVALPAATSQQQPTSDGACPSRLFSTEAEKSYEL
ncbi:MAG TPA: ATP-binding protein [Phycisphaerae bacterium]|nr:ATP-binding protein [Phycisphaerae bacterium]HOM52368.1 ATP-binding protein [Phycisphaerae bacterium]HON64947.1 ATP-binding protein [Phycisphaerae bacterium]HOQ85154.1 ATP-binding protein [Phycisphaerae bacterium]HPP27459.1 ATP-binding protein [Phycisphaerae bacterium]